MPNKRKQPTIPVFAETFWKNKKGTFKYQKIIVLSMFFIILMWGVSWLLIASFYESSGDRGTFGDMFGAVNALFSGFAFAGLIITLILQKEELSLQWREMQITREEIKAQRKEFEEQNKTLHQQRFETTFFNMLMLQQEIIAGIRYKDMVGRQLFKYFYSTRTDASQQRVSLKSKIKDDGVETYHTFEDINLFEHYFRHLYRIIKFVDHSRLVDADEKYEYLCIVRAQLSEFEQLMLFYNALTNEDEDVKPLIEKYSLFKRLRVSQLANPEHKNLYASSAFIYKV